METGLDHIILIDDARLFLAPPPRPHEAEVWPLIGDVVEALLLYNYKIIVLDDVIFCFPSNAHCFFQSLFQEVVTRNTSTAGKQGGGLVDPLMKKMRKIIASG